MEMYQRIIESINLLTQNSMEIQDKLSETMDNPDSRSPLGYAKEYCTVKVCTARRSGHTTAINYFILNKAAKLNQKWAIIYPNQHILETNKKNISEYLKSLNGNIKTTYKPNEFNNYRIVFKNGGEIPFITINSLDKLRGTMLDGIIVDCSSLLSENKIDMLYDHGINCMKKNKYKFFIFVE